MLPTHEIKAMYPNFHMEGYVYVHRTMIKSLENMVKACNRLATMSQEEITRLADWYNFFYAMVEHHHHEEDDPNCEFSFPTINRQFPMSNLEQLQTSHNTLHSNMVETNQKLKELAQVSDPQQRTALVARLQQLAGETLAELKEHLALEEQVLLPVINQHYSKAEQIKLGKGIEQRSIKETPKQYASYGLSWFVSGLSEQDKADFLKTLPLPPKLLMRFVWNKQYAEFSSVVNN